MKYLLDTNICIYYFKGKFDLETKLTNAGFNNCAISEITIAELYYGAEKSNSREKNIAVIHKFTENVAILPIFESIEIYGFEKARLRNAGMIISDLDLFIGATAISNNLVLVTNSISEFQRMQNIKLENWTSF
jgi:tRNA(fMet)-specific endonuclease VapC